MNFCQLLFSLFKSLNWLTGFISWTKPQVQARSHPNILAATAWLSKLYHVQVVDKGNSKKNEQLANTLEGVDLNVPLMYADRFRIRTAGSKWDTNLWIPHVDGECHTLLTCLPLNQDIRVGGSIERWEDPFFRKCFESIFNGNWKDHDPFALEGRLDARNSLYGKPEQSSIFRTFQGWISMTWLFWRRDIFVPRIFLTDDSIQWDRSNPRHYLFLPWCSALECIHDSETVLQPNSAL